MGKNGLPSRADVEAAIARAGGNKTAAARILRIERYQLYRILNRKDGFSEDDEQSLTEYKLQEENRRLRRLLAQAVKKNQQDAVVEAFMAEAVTAKIEIPRWLSPPQRRGKRKPPSIVNAFFSDWHLDEIVNPEEVESANAYNRQIAETRMETFFNNTVSLARQCNLEYGGIVVPLGGDIVSGIIHEELKRTNAALILDTVLHWVPKIAAGLAHFADEFGAVYAPAVVGNHGRLTRKPAMKGRVRDNFDWLVYRLLAKQFEDDDRVTVDVSEAADITYTSNGVTYRLTHGDQFRGGTGISGLFSPLMLGDHRKRSRSSNLGNAYDVLLLGHWHQLKMLGGIVVNGSGKGYDEFAYMKNFPFEPARQAFWITDAERGMTIQAPIHLD